MKKQLLALALAAAPAGLGGCIHKTEVVVIQPASHPAVHHATVVRTVHRRPVVVKKAAHEKPSPWATTVVNQYDRN